MENKSKSIEIEIAELRRESLEVCVVGRSPLILNCMAAKAKRELLLPKRKMNAAEKAGSLKHDPLQEFRDSAKYSVEDDGHLLCLPATAFKSAIRSAALVIPGATKSQIGRLTYIDGEEVGVFGKPSMMMSVVRSADINHTPDIRTRCAIKEWCAKLTIVYCVPILTGKSVRNLLSVAGEVIGVGDFRPEKGAGAFGRFEIVEETSEEYQAILANGNNVQESVMNSETPPYYDGETAKLHHWYKNELAERGKAKEPAK